MLLNVLTTCCLNSHLPTYLFSGLAPATNRDEETQGRGKPEKVSKWIGETVLCIWLEIKEKTEREAERKRETYRVRKRERER